MKGPTKKAKAATKEALDAGVARWQRIAGVSDVSEVRPDEACALCVLYREGDCIGCPVATFTGKPWCLATNHKAIIDAYLDAGTKTLLADLLGEPTGVPEALAEFRRQAGIYVGTLETVRSQWTRSNRP